MDDIVIPASLVPDIQDGTIMWINTERFTFVTSGATAADNEINVTGLTNLVIKNALDNNLGVSKDYTVTDDVDLLLTPKRATLKTTVRFENLDASPDTATIEGQANPVLLKDGYKVRMCLDCDGAIIAEVDFYPVVTVTADETDVDTITMQRNVGCFVEPHLSCPIPPIDIPGDGQDIYQTSELTCDVGVNIGEHYGGSAYFKNTLTSVRVYKADICDEAVDSEYYLSLESGQPICINCSQLFWLHRYIPIAGSYGAVTMGVVARNAAGSSIGHVAAYDSGTVSESMIYFPVGLPQVVDRLISSGGLAASDVDRIRSLTISTSVTYGGSTYANQVQISLVNTTKSINFIYKNRFNVYQGIAMHVPNTRSLSTALDYLEVCMLCKRERRVYDKEQYEVINASFFDDLCYADDQVKDFMASESIYLHYEGELFPVKMDGQEMILEENGEDAYSPITMRIYPC